MFDARRQLDDVAGLQRDCLAFDPFGGVARQQMDNRFAFNVIVIFRSVAGLGRRNAAEDAIEELRALDFFLQHRYAQARAGLRIGCRQQFGGANQFVFRQFGSRVRGRGA